jgi:hypothetical protein
LWVGCSATDFTTGGGEILALMSDELHA